MRHEQVNLQEKLHKFTSQLNSTSIKDRENNQRLMAGVSRPRAPAIVVLFHPPSVVKLNFDKVNRKCTTIYNSRFVRWNPNGIFHDNTFIW